MQIDQKLYTRGLAGKPIKVHVIVGNGAKAGHIKTVNVSHTCKPDCLEVNYLRDGQNRVCSVKSVRINDEHEENGWKLLRDAYAEEKNLAGFEVYLDFQRACEEGRGDKFQGYPDAESFNAALAAGEVKPQIIPGFPDDLLPQYCRDLASGKAKTDAIWKPPVAEKASKK